MMRSDLRKLEILLLELCLFAATSTSFVSTASNAPFARSTSTNSEDIFNLDLNSSAFQSNSEEEEESAWSFLNLNSVFQKISEIAPFDFDAALKSWGLDELFAVKKDEETANSEDPNDQALLEAISKAKELQESDSTLSDREALTQALQGHLNGLDSENNFDASTLLQSFSDAQLSLSGDHQALATDLENSIEESFTTSRSEQENLEAVVDEANEIVAAATPLRTLDESSLVSKVELSLGGTRVIARKPSSSLDTAKLDSVGSTDKPLPLSLAPPEKVIVNNKTSEALKGDEDFEKANGTASGFGSSSLVSTSNEGDSHDKPPPATDAPKLSPNSDTPLDNSFDKAPAATPAPTPTAPVSPQDKIHTSANLDSNATALADNKSTDSKNTTSLIDDASTPCGAGDVGCLELASSDYTPPRSVFEPASAPAVPAVANTNEPSKSAAAIDQLGRTLIGASDNKPVEVSTSSNMPLHPPNESKRAAATSPLKLISTISPPIKLPEVQNPNTSVSTCAGDACPNSQEIAGEIEKWKELLGKDKVDDLIKRNIPLSEVFSVAKYKANALWEKRKAVMTAALCELGVYSDTTTCEDAKRKSQVSKPVETVKETIGSTACMRGVAAIRNLKSKYDNNIQKSSSCADIEEALKTGFEYEKQHGLIASYNTDDLDECAIRISSSLKAWRRQKEALVAGEYLNRVRMPYSEGEAPDENSNMTPMDIYRTGFNREVQSAVNEDAAMKDLSKLFVQKGQKDPWPDFRSRACQHFSGALSYLKDPSFNPNAMKEAFELANKERSLNPSPTSFKEYLKTLNQYAERFYGKGSFDLISKNSSSAPFLKVFSTALSQSPKDQETFITTYLKNFARDAACLSSYRDSPERDFILSINHEAAKNLCLVRENYSGNH